MGRSRPAPRESNGGHMRWITLIPGIVLVGVTTLAAFGLPLDGESSRPSAVAGTWSAALPSTAPTVSQVPEPTVASPVRRAEWKRCTRLPAPPPGAKPPPTTIRCATIRVPLDYTQPSGETIGIAVLRVPATGGGPRVGSLLMNFGGPGGDGVDTLAQVAGEYRKLNTRYDLIGFDPRGVGRSAP